MSDKSVSAYESDIDNLVPKDARPYVCMYEDWRDRMDWRERSAKPLHWTRERPTVPGWYWARGYVSFGYQSKLVEIRELRAGLCVDEHDGEPTEPLKHKYFDDCEWAGPLVPPVG